MKVAVVIPSFKVSRSIVGVIHSVPQSINKIYVVDDRCPQGTANVVFQKVEDPRVEIIKNEKNLGVGGATIVGLTKAFSDQHDIVVKIDGDGQMDSKNIGLLVSHLESGDYGYAKGNRFSERSNLKGMPFIRIFGNFFLSFLTKLSSGYWDIMDPTNGFIAITRETFFSLDLQKISQRYFFESDLLFHLYNNRVNVIDVPMAARYGNEKSNLSITRSAVEFPVLHFRNFWRRISRFYFMENINIGSFHLVVSMLLLPLGVCVGIYNWYDAGRTGSGAPVGDVVLPALFILIGYQSFVSFLNYDTSKSPNKKISNSIHKVERKKV